MKWEDFIKRYVWDDVKTPFLVKVPRLTRQQADYELLAYSGFLGVLFGIAALVTLPGRTGSESTMMFSLYAFSMTCAAVLLHFTKLPAIARFAQSAPFAVLAYFFVLDSAPRLLGADRIALGIGVAAWVLYSFRVVAIARRYPEMEPPPADGSAADVRRR